MNKFSHKNTQMQLWYFLLNLSKWSVSGLLCEFVTEHISQSPSASCHWSALAWLLPECPRLTVTRVPSCDCHPSALGWLTRVPSHDYHLSAFAWPSHECPRLTVTWVPSLDCHASETGATPGSTCSDLGADLHTCRPHRRNSLSSKEYNISWCIVFAPYAC